MSSRTFSRLVFSGFSLVALTITASASADPTARVARAPSPWIASYAADTGTTVTDLAPVADRDSGTTAAHTSTMVSPTRIDAVGHLGLVLGKQYEGGMVGATVLAHRGDLGVGGTLEYSGGLFEKRLGVAAIGGWSRRHGNGLGLDLLGAVGVHRYMDIGRAFFSSDPGVDATLPYAGVRGRVSYLVGSAGARFQFGATVSADRDLTTVSKSTTYRDGWQSGSDTTTTEHTIGATTVGVMVDAGMHFE